LEKFEKPNEPMDVRHTMVRSLFVAGLLAVVANAFTVLELVDVVPILTGAEVCSSPDALAKNFVVSVSSDTPVKGSNMTTVFDFDLDEDIQGGTVHYDVSYNGFPYSSSSNLCDEVSKSGDSCPLIAGYHHQESTAEVTVSGKVATTITWYDENGFEILCAKITIKSV